MFLISDSGARVGLSPDQSDAGARVSRGEETRIRRQEGVRSAHQLLHSHRPEEYSVRTRSFTGF